MALFGNDANIKAVITADDKASAVVKKFGSNVTNEAGKAGGALSGFMSKAGALAVTALEGASVAAVAFGVSSVKAFEDSQDKLSQLNAVLKSTKGVAGVSAKAAIDLSQALQKVTKFSDEDVLSVENLLLTFTKIGKKIFPQATETVLNMATALGEDTKSAAIQLGKALQDPILGITALRRVGVNFSDAQKEVIKKLVETGHSAKAQQLILKELNTEFGNSAKAAGETFAGKLAILNNRFDDFKEKVGGAIVDVLIPLTDWLGGKMPVAAGIAEESLAGVKQATNEYKNAQKEAKLASQGVTQAQTAYNQSVAAFGASSISAQKALAKLQLAQLRDAQARADSKFQQQLLNAAEQRFIDSTPGVVKAIQKRANALGLVVDRLGDGISNAKQLDRVLSGITPKAVNAADILGGIKSGGLKLEHRASGGSVSRGQGYIVGEQGPELFLPNQSGSIVPNQKTGGTTIINISPQIGVYTGTEQEFRKLSVRLAKALKDAAGAKNMTASQMLS